MKENYFAECNNFRAILRHLCMNMAVNFKLPSFNSKRKEFVILIHLDRPRFQIIQMHKRTSTIFLEMEKVGQFLLESPAIFTRKSSNWIGLIGFKWIILIL